MPNDKDKEKRAPTTAGDLQIEVPDAGLDRVFAALADPVRRTILKRLEAGELCVSELAEPFDISLQAVSKHIQVLVRAGLVAQERSGRVSRCRLDTGPIQSAAVWLNQYSHYWQTQFDSLAAGLGRIAQRDSEPGTQRRKSVRRSTRDA